MPSSAQSLRTTCTCVGTPSAALSSSGRSTSQTSSSSAQGSARLAPSNVCPETSRAQRLSPPKRREKPAARTSPATVRLLFPGSEFITRPSSVYADDIGHRRQGDFGRCLTAQRQAYGHVQAGDLGLAQTAGATQTLGTHRRGTLRAHNADIKSWSTYCFDHGQVIDTRIVGQRHHRGGSVATIGGDELRGQFLAHLDAGHGET